MAGGPFHRRFGGRNRMFDMALQANIPDVIDDSGDKRIGLSMVMNDVVPNVLGVGVAAVIVSLGLGVFNSIQPILGNVPLVGSLLSSGQNNGPAAWQGA